MDPIAADAENQSSPLLSEEQIILAKLNNAFRGDEFKINQILEVWPEPRTIQSFVNTFQDGDPPPIWDNLELSAEDYRQFKSVVESMAMQAERMAMQAESIALQAALARLEKKMDRMICLLM